MVRDWLDWHRPYDQPGSRLHRRLLVVQQRLRSALDRCDPGPIRLVSMCAGQGRDVLPVIADHPRRADVVARLVELDPRNVAAARATASAAGLTAVEVEDADGSSSSAYSGAVPAGVVLACGIFGNVSDDDIDRTVAALPMFCAPGGTVIWTRHRAAPDLTPTIRRWFAEAGFAELSFDAPDDLDYGVGAHRLVRSTPPFQPGVHLFTFLR